MFLENGYTVISIKDLDDADKGKIELPEKPIIITFDDGYYSNYEYIYPILQKYNVKASIFVVTDKIGKEIEKNLGKQELKVFAYNIPCEMTGKEIIDCINEY